MKKFLAIIFFSLFLIGGIFESANISAAVYCNFIRDLYLGVSGSDVLCLQKYLNGSGFTVALSGPGSPGNETTFFGILTQNAVANWQVANGISPTSGYFGATSRAKYDQLNQTAIGVQSPSPTPTPASLTVKVKASPNPVGPNQEVIFTATVSGGVVFTGGFYDGTYEFSWTGDCNEGNNSFGPGADKCAISFPNAGNYTATVKVTDAAGKIAYGSDSVTVKVLPLTASVDVYPDPAKINQQVFWSASAAGGTGKYTFFWTGPCTPFQTGMGGPVGPTDGCKGSFSRSGNYTATVTVEDEGNPQQTAHASRTVTVKLSVFIYVSPNPARIGQMVWFTASATGGTSPYAYSWSGCTPFGGVNTTPNQCFFMIPYTTAPKQYTATVNVRDAAGGTGDASIVVTSVSPFSLEDIQAQIASISDAIAKLTQQLGIQIK